MKLSMITRTVTGTIGGYTMTKETTMKQIDTAQLDITACQAQAAEYHARGFNCAQAVACTLAPAVGLDPQVAFTLTEGFGAGMGGMTETCGAISGAVAIMGFVMSDGMAFWQEEHDNRLRHAQGHRIGQGSAPQLPRLHRRCRRDRLRCAKAARRVNGSNIKRRPARLGSIQKNAGRRR